METFMRKSKLSSREKLTVVGLHILRNVKLWTRFTASFYMGILQMVSEAAVFLFIGRWVTNDSGVQYVSFVILGLAFARFLFATISGCYSSLSIGHSSAMLEPILLSPSSVNLMVIGDLIWTYINTSLYVVCYLLLGWAFGMRIEMGFQLVGMALGVLVLSILSVLGFGYMSAAMFMLANAKGGNEPINWFISTLQGLVSGVYFPISVMPNWLQWISLCLPQTYGIDAARRLLLVGKSGDVTIPTQALLPFSPLVTDIMMLILFIVILLPLGLWVFKLGLNKAKVDGGLSRWS